VSDERHPKEWVLANGETAQTGTPGQITQFGGSKSPLTRRRGIEARDGIADDGLRHDLAQRDCDPISPKIVDNVAAARNIVDPPQDCNHLTFRKMVESQGTKYEVKAVGPIRKMEQVCLFQANFWPAVHVLAGNLEDFWIAVDAGKPHAGSDDSVRRV